MSPTFLCRFPHIVSYLSNSTFLPQKHKESWFSVSASPMEYSLQRKKKKKIPRKEALKEIALQNYSEAWGWRALLKITFQASICRGPAPYGRLLDTFNSFFTTGSILFSFLIFFFLPTVQYTTGLPLFPLSPIWNAILSNTRGQASRKPALKELKGRREAKEGGVCVKRTNGRFIWALSLYHQLSGSAASIEMELGPGEVHSFIRAESR